MTMPLGVRRAYLFFWKLKSLYVGGEIFDYSKRLPELAAQFGISERTARTFVQVLRSRNMVSTQKGRLVLTASWRVGQAEMTSVSSFYQIPVSELPKLEAYVEARAIEEKMRQQEYVKRHRALDELIRREVGISDPSTLSKSARARYRKMLAAQVPSFEQDNTTRYFQDQARPDAPARDKLNPRVTLGRAGLAATLGLRSTSSGTRKARKLVAAGYLHDDVCEVTVRAYASRDEWTALRRADFAGNYNLRYRNGRIVRVLANQLTVILPERT